MSTNNRDLLAFSVLSAVETAGILGNACPPLSEIADNGGDPAFRRRLRDSYVKAGLLSFGLATGLAILTESAVPIGAWALGAGGWVMLCESEIPAPDRLSPLSLFRANPRDLTLTR